MLLTLARSEGGWKFSDRPAGIMRRDGYEVGALSRSRILRPIVVLTIVVLRQPPKAKLAESQEKQ